MSRLLSTVVAASILSLSAYGITFKEITGTWTITSLKQDKSVTFAKDRNRDRGGSLTLEFNRAGKVRVNESSNIYFFELENGLLKITVEHQNFVLDRKNRIDILNFTGKLDNNCYKVKYENKGLGGMYYKKGYRMCKIEDYPKPVQITQPYKF